MRNVVRSKKLVPASSEESPKVEKYGADIIDKYQQGVIKNLDGSAGLLWWSQTP